MSCESRLKFGLLEELTHSLTNYKQKGKKFRFPSMDLSFFKFTFLCNSKRFAWEGLPGEDEGV